MCTVMIVMREKVVVRWNKNVRPVVVPCVCVCVATLEDTPSGLRMFRDNIKHCHCGSHVFRFLENRNQFGMHVLNILAAGSWDF